MRKDLFDNGRIFDLPIVRPKFLGLPSRGRPERPETGKLEAVVVGLSRALFCQSQPLRTSVRFSSKASSALRLLSITDSYCFKLSHRSQRITFVTW